MGKLNCWEFKKCGRESGGENASELGVCPAATENKLNGAHGGKNGGRACWVIAGTLCKGQVQGVFALKLGNCLNCDFYVAVRNEEKKKFLLSSILLKKMI